MTDMSLTVLKFIVMGCRPALQIHQQLGRLKHSCLYIRLAGVLELEPYKPLDPRAMPMSAPFSSAQQRSAASKIYLYQSAIGGLTAGVSPLSSS